MSTPMTVDEKKWIDEADIEALLRKWRATESGDPMFEGITSQYYTAVMARKRKENPAAYTAASKKIMRAGECH